MGRNEGRRERRIRPAWRGEKRECLSFGWELKKRGVAYKGDGNHLALGWSKKYQFFSGKGAGNDQWGVLP